ncbi:MAG: hypothetical protein IK015_04750 [Treponema sp.]|nr:hypothetical protein [Treponema sp.]
MKQILKALPFVAVLAMLLGSVFFAKTLHSKKSGRFHVNTGSDKNGEIHTVRKFVSISSVVIIDMNNHSKKRKIPPSEFSYNTETTQIIFANPLPFENSVVHVEGTIARPEKFYLHDFSGTAESLLVLLNGREAMENYEYTYSPEARTLTFRNDIQPESDGIFFIMYQTQDGQTHSFGNWCKKDGDKLAELEWNWLCKTQNIPPMVMKDRSGLSNKKLSKEVGFSVQLPKGDSTFLIEKMEGGERVRSVMRWFDKSGLVVECKDRPFSDGGANQCEWEQNGTYYQMIVPDGKSDIAQKLMKDFH